MGWMCGPLHFFCSDFTACIDSLACSGKQESLYPISIIPYSYFKSGAVFHYYTDILLQMRLQNVRRFAN